MADSVNISTAQRLDIVAYRGEKFKLVINVKNADGTDYDFRTTMDDGDTPTDIMRLIVLNSDGSFPSAAGSDALEEPDSTGSYWSSFSSTYFDTGDQSNSLTTGKMTFESDEGLPLWPGVYEYYLMTRPNESGNFNNKYWLYGKFTVKPINAGNFGDFSF